MFPFAAAALATAAAIFGFEGVSAAPRTRITLREFTSKRNSFDDLFRTFAGIGSSAELSEGGFQSVAASHCSPELPASFAQCATEMRSFVSRMAQDHGLILSDDDMKDLVFNNTGTGSASFVELSRQMRQRAAYPSSLDFGPDFATNELNFSFYLYDLDEHEPRFNGWLSKCRRKGADYMFLEGLVRHEQRTWNSSEASVFVVPCLFESFRRCTTTNHAEQPPVALLDTGGDDHPEDFEQVPWTKPVDSDTDVCLKKVMASEAYKASSGDNHLWVVADWAMNFGRTIEQTTFRNMTIGRIEVVDGEAAKISNRRYALTQSKCSVVVPYASDAAYVENFTHETKYGQWAARSNLVSFRFEDRRYVLFCKSTPCPGAVDALPLRKQSLEFARRLNRAWEGAPKPAYNTSISMTRVPLAAYVNDLRNSKFCLVMRGDTPSTHSFYDALAASCVPILVSDRWPLVGKPFAGGKNGKLVGNFPYEDFVVTFTEDQWMNDLDGVIARLESIIGDEATSQAYFENMQRARHSLLWSMPNNTAVGSVLRAARRCGDEVRETLL
mmetsp:Transcript_81391/g.226697  ORF Transcript_81391/g.226697 Transcript_81391/m.226697 type:complete len:555 (+) Transcript_81391:125-1789(+)